MIKQLFIQTISTGTMYLTSGKETYKTTYIQNTGI